MAVRAWNQLSDAPESSPPISDTLHARMCALEMPLMPHSATDIRALAATEQALTGLVPPAVERYIHEHHLYRLH
jgi:nicotinate-nucleotide adenylyltransferase